MHAKSSSHVPDVAFRSRILLKDRCHRWLSHYTELFPKQDGLLVGLLPKVLLGREVEQESANEALPEGRESGYSGIPTDSDLSGVGTAG